jgi:hypothetical protein
MNRTLARAIASPVVLIVSFATVPLVSAQDSAQAAPAAGSIAQGQGSAQSTPQETNPSNHQPPVEMPENPGRNDTQQPAANAPAPQVETSGGAASKPAGVAIAPPKQRRARSLLIKLGILAGAGVAIGTVAGLSAASPSHVPNSAGH